LSTRRFSRGLWVGAVLAVALAALIGIGVWRGPRGAAKERPLATNVVVLLVDTLRADHLSLYGYRRETSPHLDAWAARAGVVFEDARAQAPCTFPSANSILTSVSPGVFYAEMRRADTMAIPAAVPTLAQILAAAGFDTAAVSASPIVRKTPSDENPDGGYGAGFRIFDESVLWKDAGAVGRRAAEVLGGLAEPFLLYVHYMDPHDPYAAPPAADGGPPFAAEAPAGAPEFLLRGDPDPVATRIYAEHRDPGVSAAEIAYLVARYDDEIRYWDSQLATLLDALEASGRAGRTVVAIVADHGEEFLEHGDVKHCRSLYDNELHVPFVLFVPGVAPRRVAAPVANLDLLPTLLDLVGVVPRAARPEGRTLRPLLADGGSVPPADQYAAWSSLQSLSDGRFKLIRDARAQSFRLFDLARDPGETVDRAADDPAVAEKLRRALWNAYASQNKEALEGGEEAAARLRALGYLQ
jgi:arylsulfatase A-like enzyme